MTSQNVKNASAKVEPLATSYDLVFTDDKLICGASEKNNEKNDAVACIYLTDGSGRISARGL